MTRHNTAFVHGSINGTNDIPISFKVLPMVPLVKTVGSQCVCSWFYQWYTNIVQGYTNGTIGNTIGTNGNANGTICSPNGTVGTIGKLIVPLATNGTIGKIANGIIGRTLNRAIISNNLQCGQNCQRLKVT